MSCWLVSCLPGVLSLFRLLKTTFLAVWPCFLISSLVAETLWSHYSKRSRRHPLKEGLWSEGFPTDHRKVVSSDMFRVFPSRGPIDFCDYFEMLACRMGPWVGDLTLLLVEPTNCINSCFFCSWVGTSICVSFMYQPSKGALTNADFLSDRGGPVHHYHPPPPTTTAHHLPSPPATTHHQ